MSETPTLMFAAGNVCNNPLMPQAHVIHDCARLASIGADVTCAVEIRPRRYKHAFSSMMSRAGNRVYNLGSEAPIAAKVPVRRSAIRKLYDGVARVTPGRVNSVLRLEVEPPVLVLGKHPVSGAYRRGTAAARTFGMPIRRRLFALDRVLTARRVARAHKRGLNVVILGDLNALAAPSYNARQVLASRRGLIYVIACPAPGYGVHLGREAHVPLNLVFTDHPFIGREIAFLREGGR